MADAIDRGCGEFDLAGDADGLDGAFDGDDVAVGVDLDAVDVDFRDILDVFGDPRFEIVAVIAVDRVGAQRILQPVLVAIPVYTVDAKAWIVAAVEIRGCFTVGAIFRRCGR